jgi:hypothetical protein
MALSIGGSGAKTILILMSVNCFLGNKHLSIEECHAYNRPFTDRGHRAALHAFPPMVPEHEISEGAEISAQALRFLRSELARSILDGHRHARPGFR